MKFTKLFIALILLFTVALSAISCTSESTFTPNPESTPSDKCAHTENEITYIKETIIPTYSAFTAPILSKIGMDSQVTSTSTIKKMLNYYRYGSTQGLSSNPLLFDFAATVLEMDTSHPKASCEFVTEGGAELFAARFTSLKELLTLDGVIYICKECNKRTQSADSPCPSCENAVSLCTVVELLFINGEGKINHEAIKAYPTFVRELAIHCYLFPSVYDNEAMMAVRDAFSQNEPCDKCGRWYFKSDSES